MQAAPATRQRRDGCAFPSSARTQAVKLPLIASLLSKGTKEVVTAGVVYWGAAAQEPLKVRGATPPPCCCLRSPEEM